jgi:hypothetical protein
MVRRGHPLESNTQSGQMPKNYQVVVELEVMAETPEQLPRLLATSCSILTLNFTPMFTRSSTSRMRMIGCPTLIMAGGCRLAGLTTSISPTG